MALKPGIEAEMVQPLNELAEGIGRSNVPAYVLVYCTDDNELVIKLRDNDQMTGMHLFTLLSGLTIAQHRAVMAAEDGDLGSPLIEGHGDAGQPH